AMDFFTVPTITFGVLYCFFVIAHDRRRILYFNVTKHLTSRWTVQQLREAFPFGDAPRFLIFDRDAKYGLELSAAVRSLQMRPVQTSLESPWQNGVGGALGGKLSSRPIGPRHRSERTTSEATPLRIRPLLPPGPYASGTREENAQPPRSFLGFRSRDFSRATWRIASSLRSGCLRPALCLRSCTPELHPSIYVCS